MHLAIAAADMLVISPHLDDAVLSCGEVIAAHPDTLVVTLFSGVPAETAQPMTREHASGLRAARQALAARRRQDRAALACIGGRALPLDFTDVQYDEPVSMEKLAMTLANVVLSVNPERILLPAGLYRPDNVATHAAALQAMRLLRPVSAPGQRRFGERDWLMYEETAYRRLPGALQRRIATLAAAGIEATPVRPHPHTKGIAAAAAMVDGSGCKQAALQCYRNPLPVLQADDLLGLADPFAPEGYWRLELA